MAKLVYYKDTLHSAVLDSPQECEAVAEALEFVLDADRKTLQDFVSRNGLGDLEEWVGRVQVTLGHLRTPAPRRQS